MPVFLAYIFGSFPSTTSRWMASSIVYDLASTGVRS